MVGREVALSLTAAGCGSAGAKVAYGDGHFLSTVTLADPSCLYLTAWGAVCHVRRGTADGREVAEATTGEIDFDSRHFSVPFMRLI